MRRDQRVGEPRDHGILFKGPLVREIRADRKTQTRRLPTELRELRRSDTRGYDWAWRDRRGLWNEMSTADLLASRRWCPVQVGDRLWVRETCAIRSGSTSRDHVLYRADFSSVGSDALVGSAYSRWTPSIFMPRWASRITLEVTAIRLEPLQDISEDDARAEGVRPSDAAIVFANDEEGNAHHRADLSNTARGAFAVLWDSINGKRAPWSNNPLVWVRTFRRLP